MSDYDDMLRDFVAFKKAREQLDKTLVFIQREETRKETREILISLQEGVDWERSKNSKRQSKK